MRCTAGTFIGAPVSIGLDYMGYKNGEISGMRFGYRTGSFGVSVGAGAVVGGPWGAFVGGLIGGASVAGEFIYDNVFVPIGNEINYGIWRIENGLKNGWYPGR